MKAIELKFTVGEGTTITIQSENLNFSELKQQIREVLQGLCQDHCYLIGLKPYTASTERIPMIKAIRQVTNLGLKDAKLAVDTIFDNGQGYVPFTFTNKEQADIAARVLNGYFSDVRIVLANAGGR